MDELIRRAHQATVEQANIATRSELRDILQLEIQKVEKCDGADPSLVRRWVKDIELATPTLDRPTRIALRIALISATVCGPLRSEFEAFIRQQPNREQTEWPLIRDHLLATFVSADQLEYQRGLLAKVKQQPGEIILRYNMRFRDAALEAYPGDRNADQQRELVRLYGVGLASNSDARKLVEAGWPATLEQAFHRMVQRQTGEERYSHLGRREEDMDISEIQPSQENNNTEKALEQIVTKLAALKAANKVRDERELRGGPVHRVPRTEGSAATRRERRPECFHCGQTDHFIRNCPQRTRCSNCGRGNHLTQNCYLPIQRPSRPRSYGRRPSHPRQYQKN